MSTLSSAASWRGHAIFSAYLSIIAGLVETVLSLREGHEEISMSLYGIALMAFVDMTGSLLVLSLWQCSDISKDRGFSQRIREMRYSVLIGMLMIGLGVFLIADSIKSLIYKDSPDEENPMGTVVCVFGTVFGIGLATYKYRIGQALDSPVIIADAVTSFCAGLTSFAALAVVLVSDRFWWSDSTAGLVTALYTFYSGIITCSAASSEISRLLQLAHIDAVDAIVGLSSGGGADARHHISYMDAVTNYCDAGYQYDGDDKAAGATAAPVPTQANHTYNSIVSRARSNSSSSSSKYSTSGGSSSKTAQKSWTVSRWLQSWMYPSTQYRHVGNSEPYASIPTTESEDMDDTGTTFSA